jgi:hypothetical protein
MREASKEQHQTIERDRPGSIGNTRRPIWWRTEQAKARRAIAFDASYQELFIFTQDHDRT